MVEKIGRMRAFACKRIKDFSSNCDGSEAVEMVYNMVALVFLVLSTLLIIGYALQMNQVSYAAQRIARAVEPSKQRLIGCFTNCSLMPMILMQKLLFLRMTG